MSIEETDAVLMLDVKQISTCKRQTQLKEREREGYTAINLEFLRRLFDKISAYFKEKLEHFDSMNSVEEQLSSIFFLHRETQ